MATTLVDTHAHLDAFAESGELDAVLERAARAGVSRTIAIGGTPAANALAVSLPRRYPGRVWAAAGLDRDQLNRETSVEGVRRCLGEPGVVAVGEIGLDYHHGPDTAEAQRRLFSTLLDLAAETGRPALIHSRDADEDTLRLLAPFVARWRGAGPAAVLHCFTGGRDFASRLLDLGLMISFSGIITFRNAGELRAVARFVPEDRLLVETDAPYLAPEPHRGGRNEPAFLREVAAMLAKIRNDTPERITHITTLNAERTFRLEAGSGS
jgi:TatD DNase family protein